MVKCGANVDEMDTQGRRVLSYAIQPGFLEIVVYLVEHGANVVQKGPLGMTAIHEASMGGHIPLLKYLLLHGARITERDKDNRTALLLAVEEQRLDVVQFLLSSEGGASVTETDDGGDTPLLAAASVDCFPPMVQWLLEYGGAQITDTDNNGNSVWICHYKHSLPDMLRCAYKRTPRVDQESFVDYISVDGDYVPDGDIEPLVSMLRVMLLHGGPPESLAKNLAPPLRRIVKDGARLRARLPAYLTRRRALLDAHCPLLPPLQAIVHGYEEPTTTDEIWATGLGAP
jgi:hypothetical protein